MAKSRQEGIQRRHKRIRKKVFGTGQRLRFSVYRSLNHIYAQIIDDLIGHTVVSASSLEVNPPSPPLVKEGVKPRGGHAPIRGKGRLLKQHKGNIKTAREVGDLITKRALEKGIKKVVFDRSGYLYHGRVKALAETAREAGLEF